MTQSSAIEYRIEPVTRDLGEFSVRRALPDKRRQRVGPFIFFDHMGPADFPPGTGVNVRAHPHIGLATITYLFEGEILHRDSLGYVQPIRPGAVNWMTAGRGIVHSEKAPPGLRESGQRLHGLQTWVALPTDCEEMEPSFEHYPADSIPRIVEDGVESSVIVGCAFGETSPVTTQSTVLYVAVDLDAGKSVAIPDAEEIAIYVVEGSVAVNDDFVNDGVLAVLEPGATGTVTAETKSKFVFCGGDVLEGERIIWWNFVTSSRGRLEQAKRDWREGRFDAVPGETDFIPLPEGR